MYLTNASIILTFLFASIQIWANPDCSTIDHRERLPKIRNQIGFSWCYAFASADLLSFETRQTISAIGTGIQQRRYFYKSYKERNGFLLTVQERISNVSKDRYDFESGGDIYNTLLGNLNNGPLCLEEELPQEYHVVYVKKDGTKVERASRTEWDRIQTAIKEYRPSKRGILQPGTPLCNRMDAAAKTVLPGVDTDDFRELSLSLSRHSDPLPALYDLACQNRVPPPRNLEPFMENRAGDGKNLVEILDTQLNRAPAIIGYDSNQLKNPNPFAEPAEGNHVSVVVMRKFNEQNGKCEYLVRNSGGSECQDKYHATLRCQEGHFWITREMIKQTHSISGLKPTTENQP